MPAYVFEGGPFRPDIHLWLELPDGLIVWGEVVDPRKAVRFSESLGKAMKSPQAGPPRRPERVRVTEAALARELRETFPSLDVAVAPAPELDEVIQEMARTIPGEAPVSYLEDGRVPEEVVADLFRAAKLLWRTAPWKIADDSQLIRVDVPAYAVEGCFVSIIGALGESLGFLLFPSIEGYEAFADLAERQEEDEGAPLDLGTTMIGLDFERGANLPVATRREVARHRWSLAGPDAYPRVTARDRDGVPRPLEVRELRSVAAIAETLPSFVHQHRALFQAEEAEPVSVSYDVGRGLEVRFTLPCDRYDLFEPDEPVGEPASASPRVGRNDACPCGSGRKYKKCCLGREASRGSKPDPAELHELDQRIVEELCRFAGRRFGEAWTAAGDDFADFREAVQLAIPWSVYGFPVEGRPVIDWFLEKRGPGLPPSERGWLQAQRRAWLSVWEVVAVERGRGMTMRDLLSGEERFVEERKGSEVMAARDTLLARVTDGGGVSILCGAHPRPLPPEEAGDVVRRARSRLRRKGAVSPERLRDGELGRYLIRSWERAVSKLDRRRKVPPELRNSGGDPILLTTDHYRFDPSRRTEVLERLETLDDAERVDEAGPEAMFDVSRESPSGGFVLFATIRVGSGSLRIEANSIARADVYRRKLEAACGGLVRHRVREHTDPRSGMKRGKGGASGLRAEPSPEAQQLVLRFKEEHYSGWIDQSLPALSGKTPRETARTRSGRERLDLLLRDMENHEARQPEGERFDFSRLRADLGLGR